VLVDRGEAEDGHDRVADVLLDRASVGVEHASHLLEVAREHLAHDLRVERVAEGGRPLQVRKDDRDELSRLAGRGGGERRPAEAAEPETVRVFFPAGRTDRHRTSVRDASKPFRTRTRSGVNACKENEPPELVIGRLVALALL